jgi:hypothetical protein
LKCRKVAEKNAGKITVHAAQNGSKTPKTARPSVVNSRAGLLTAHQAATLAWAGNSAPRLGRRRPARPRPLCGRRIRSDGHVGFPVDQNPPPRARRPNPRAFPSCSPQLLLPPPPPRDGGRRCGAAAGLLAGECARLDVSAPPSSGLGVASWPTHHGAVEIRERDELGMARPVYDGGPPELLSNGGAFLWSSRLPESR